MINTEQVRFFFDNGYLILPSAISRDEVQELRDASERIIQEALQGRSEPSNDVQWGRVRDAERVLRRIEYMQSKDEAFLRLLAHPVLLDAAANIVGEKFVPTYDSMVVKMPGRGVEVPWHRDGGGPTLFYDEPESGRRFPSVNFDIYLDEANAQTGALWVVPGSNKLGDEEVRALREAGRYEDVPGAVRVDMQPGDVLLHDTTLYHGSPETQGSPSMRRVLYYEFRDMRFIDAVHRPQPDEPVAGHKWPLSWTGARLALLQKALDARQARLGDAPFAQHPIEELRVSSEDAAKSPARVPHPGWDK